MSYLWTICRAGTILGLVTLGVWQASAQKAGGASAGNAPGPTRPVNPPSNPTLSPNIPSRVPFPGSSSRPLFFDGRVQFDDGTAISPEVRIERVCGGTPYMQAHTDAHGNFAFQLG